MVQILENFYHNNHQVHENNNDSTYWAGINFLHVWIGKNMINMLVNRQQIELNNYHRTLRSL